jgi:eukaryotic-like serine/threonine-protein kinase
MTVGAGTRFGPYEVIAALGAGGMGEVYKARDTRLDRTVAIKILPELLARDPQYRARFEREARAISQLDHPHICPLYDVGDEGGTAFLVMQYLEGETLADRLKRGGLPLDLALAYAVQIADALDKAHHIGTVHRDLKPGNIFLTKAGAKLLDFGLAKTAADAMATVSTLATRAPDLTTPGTILGTVAYMAPEQLEGAETDARTDIFAFGAVLHEMTTGRKAFDGRSPASLVAAIMHAHPPAISSLQPMAPPLLDHVVSRCLAKDRDERWQTASDLKRELEWIAQSLRGSIAALSPAPATSLSSWRRAAYGASVVAIALATASGYLLTRPAQTSAGAVNVRRVRVSIAPPADARFSSVQVALSPDGTRAAYIALAGQQRQLWVYSVASGESHLVAASQNATFPFWSADSEHLGFFTNEELVRVKASGGPIQTLATALTSAGGAWSDQGVLLFARRDTPGIYRLAPGGGQPVSVTRLDPARDEVVHAHPRFLPGGNQFLYWALSRRSKYTGAYIRSLDVDDRKLLVQTATHAEYVAPGFLLFVRDSILLAQRLDLSHRELQGEPIPVAQYVNVNIDNGGSAFSVSRDGSLLYHSIQVQAALKWLDRRGHVIDSLTPHGMFREVELSPDSRTALVRMMPKEITESGDLWTIDVSRGVMSRLTHGAHSLNARWARDGTQVFFDAHRGGVDGIYQIRADGSGSEHLVWKTSGTLADVSRAGQLLVEDGHSCMVVASGKQPPIAKTILELGRTEGITAGISAMTSCGRLTDDMRFMAYTLDASGQAEVYVAPFPEGAPRVQVSKDGGREPRWRKDGRELFYLSPDGTLMSVALTLTPALQASAPKPLFPGGALTSGPSPGYSVSDDGQRFLMVDPIGDSRADALTLIVGWNETLKR